MRRNRRAGVEDRWTKTVRDAQGNATKVPTSRHGKGMRWLARYVDDQGREHSKAFGRKADAQSWLDQQVSDQVTGTWTDPRAVDGHVRNDGRTLAVHQGHPVGQDPRRVSLATGHRGADPVEGRPAA